MADFWDERYSRDEYVYGEEPNEFLASQLTAIKPGKILFPCDGEGRNGVYAAVNGWEVQAFDGSREGRVKALALAASKGVSMDCQIADASTISYAPASFDAVALIFSHLPLPLRSDLNNRIVSWLKPGGRIIGELFSPAQLMNQSGGPKDPEMLYTIDIVRNDFPGFSFEILELKDIELAEGDFHKGKGSVVRFAGTKPI